MNNTSIEKDSSGIILSVLSPVLDSSRMHASAPDETLVSTETHVTSELECKTELEEHEIY